MVTDRRERYSSIQAAREIVPTADVIKFLEKVKRIGSEVVGYRDTASLRLLPEAETADATTKKPEREHLGISNLTVYDERHLQYTHFERRARPTEGLNRYMARVNERFGPSESLSTASDINSSRPEDQLRHRLAQIGLSHGLGEQSQLFLPVTDFDTSTKAEYADLGEEYAMVIDYSPVAEMLIEQNEAIFQNVKRTGPGSYLCSGRQPNTELLIPFARLPANVDTDEQDKFEAWVADCLAEQPLNLVAGSIQWNSKLR